MLLREQVDKKLLGGQVVEEKLLLLGKQTETETDEEKLSKELIVKKTDDTQKPQQWQ